MRQTKGDQGSFVMHSVWGILRVKGK